MQSSVLKLTIGSLLSALIYITFAYLLISAESSTRYTIERKNYAINPNTILEELNQGKTSIFISQGDIQYQNTIEREHNPVHWDQDDYMKIAFAANQKSLDLSSETWGIDAAYLFVDCLMVNDGFREATFSFKGIDGRDYYESVITIQPQKNELEIYKKKHYPLRTAIGVVSADELQITAEAAIKIAEENGGSQIRERANRACYLLVTYRPTGLDEDEGWHIQYLATFDDRSLGYYRIDTDTGELHP
jgi:hypothetical protein